jgi:hypothetical protein
MRFRAPLQRCCALVEWRIKDGFNYRKWVCTPGVTGKFKTDAFTLGHIFFPYWTCLIPIPRLFIIVCDTWSQTEEYIKCRHWPIISSHGNYQRKRKRALFDSEDGRDSLLAHGFHFLLQDRLMNCSTRNCFVQDVCGSIYRRCLSPINSGAVNDLLW